MSEWAGVMHTTITKYFRGETESILRNRKVLAMLNDRGQISTGQSGIDFQWQPRYLQNVPSGFGDMSGISFPRVDRHLNAKLGWRGYAIGEGIHDRERLMNRGAEALVKLFADRTKLMRKDVEDALGLEVYVDGAAAGNEDRFHGIESLMLYSGAVSSSKVGSPHATYASLTTDLGSYGGTWTGNWPDGYGPSEYDFWSPVIVDYTNTAWPQSTKTWDNTCIDATRYGLMTTRRNGAMSDKVDVVIHEREMYRKFITLFQTEERIQVQDGTSGLKKLGFTDVVNFDGHDITWEFGPASGVGYGWCMGEVEMLILGDEFIKVGGPVLDEASQMWRFWVTIPGNMKFAKPRNFLSFKAVS